MPDASLTVEARLALIQADPVYALVKRRRELRSAAWLPYVGLPGALEKAENDAEQLQAQIDQLRSPPSEKVSP